MDELGLDPARVNPNGGAIALGHPLGASGARLVTMVVHELARTGGRYGLATMCIGVGQGIATVVERIEALNSGTIGAGPSGCWTKSVAVRTIGVSPSRRARDPATRGDASEMIDAQPTRSSPCPTPPPTKLRELTKDETNPEIGLRVYVYSGGCSGYRYGMMLEDQPTTEDNVLSANGVRVYIDNNSMPLIQGSEIDYVDTLMGAGLHGQQPERRLGLRLRLQLPHRRGRRHGAELLPLTPRAPRRPPSSR